MTSILNAWAWFETVALIFLGTPVMFLVFCLTVPFDRGRYITGRLFRLIGVAAVKLNPLWRFDTSCEPGLIPTRPFVAVSNHESYADIFLISHLPWEMKWFTKDTLFRIPAFGWMMRMAGDISVTRGERASAVKAMDEARDRLKKRVSVMVFPEGTRSRDGELLPFKDGAFRLALESGVPIVPLVVAGTRHAMAKGSFRFQRARARVKVLAPIETAGLTLDDLAEVRDRTRRLISEARRALVLEMGG